jgi:FdhD protein
MEIQTKSKPVTFSKGNWKESNHKPPEESSVILTINGETWLSFGCSPFNLEELAVGFLFNEHIIDSFAEVESVRVCENKTNIDVWLDHPAKKPDKWENTSGCSGGKTSLINKKEIYISDDFQIEAQRILDLFSVLLTKQELYKETRGIHCSLLSDGKDKYYLAEDIGRHNTVDKIAGLYLMNGNQDWSPKIIFTTGRISSDMIQKTARLGIPIAVSRTCPMKSSVDFAQENNITLIGYSRRNEFTIYTHPERITD